MQAWRKPFITFASETTNKLNILLMKTEMKRLLDNVSVWSRTLMIAALLQFSAGVNATPSLQCNSTVSVSIPVVDANDDKLEELYLGAEDSCRAGNEEVAVELWREAANKGHVKAQYMLGCCYDRGIGVPQSLEDALLWYHSAAENGLADAQLVLGIYYENKEDPSYEEAVEWYAKAAKQGHTQAIFNISCCYAKGLGVEKSVEKAVELCTLAAEQGDAHAQFNLGLCYFCGDGVSLSYDTAAHWFHKAAEQDHVGAMYSLVQCYEEGLGVPQSFEEAAWWFSKAQGLME